MGTPIDIRKVKQYLNPENTLVQNFVLLSSINSTNEYAKQHADSHGTVILAEKQTAGKGRLGRKWIAPAGSSVLMSVVIFPEDRVTSQVLNLAAGSVVAEALESIFSLVPSVRWPNDVFINDRKIAGILTETIFQGDTLAKYIMGIGVNVHQSEEDFPKDIRHPATSVEMETGNDGINRNRLIAAILNHLYSGMYRINHHDVSGVLDAWRARADQLGEEVKLFTEKGSHRGRFIDISDDGAAIIEIDGSQKIVTSGEIVSIT